MKKNRRTPVSRQTAIEGIGRYWDRHDVSAIWYKTKPVQGKIVISSEVSYYAVSNETSAAIRRVARKRRISAEALLNQWVQERLSA